LSGTYLNRENNPHANCLTLEIAGKKTPRENIHVYSMLFFFLCSKALIAQERLIHVETPGPYQQVSLSEFCITPSEHETLKLEVNERGDATVKLFTDSGTSAFQYQIVIGGNANRAAMIRRRRPGILGEKQYVFVGLYETSINPYVFLFLSESLRYITHRQRSFLFFVPKLEGNPEIYKILTIFTAARYNASETTDITAIS